MGNVQWLFNRSKRPYIMCNYMKTATAIILLMILFSCNQVDKTQQAISIFTKPVIAQPLAEDSIKYIEPIFIDGFFPCFAGKHKFTDTLFIAGYRVRVAELITVNFSRRPFVPTLRWGTASLSFG